MLKIYPDYSVWHCLECVPVNLLLLLKNGGHYSESDDIHLIFKICKNDANYTCSDTNLVST